jgi:DNA-directed RNA polymerase specialized sigma24 family protein
LSPADLSPKEPSDESSISPRNVSAEKWVLTKDSFDKLLKCFSPESEEAGRLYLVMRTKLTRYFEWRSCPLAEDEADKTINIVARRIAEGENIFNLRAYFFSVARLVFMETLEPRKRTVPLDEVPELPDEQSLDNDQEEQKEARMRCLDQCLEKLTIENSKLILEYYQDELRAKIDHRKELARVLGIPLNALRIRAHRIRIFLEKCVDDCLSQIHLNRNITRL